MINNKALEHGSVLYLAIKAGSKIALVESAEDHSIYTLTPNAEQSFDLLVKSRTLTHQADRKRWVAQLIFSHNEIQWLNSNNNIRKAFAVVTKEADSYYLFFVPPNRYQEVLDLIDNNSINIYRAEGGSFWVEGIERSFPQTTFAKQFS